MGGAEPVSYTHLDVYKRQGKSLGEALLVPTRIYVKPVLALLEKVPVYAICHITGGGFYENPVSYTHLP